MSFGEIMPESESPQRYSIHDEYTIGEMLGRYVNGNREDRLNLLAEVNKTESLPYELATLAVNDPDPMIRHWMAKNAADLDFREQKSTDSNKLESYLYPERNLWEKIKSDKETFVRTALYENPNYSPSTNFENLSHHERLALLRNTEFIDDIDILDPNVISQIFDTSHQPAKLSLKEREEIALAYLSNPENTRSSDDKWCYPDRHKHVWRFLKVFPSYKVKMFGFQHLAGEDKWKAEAYRETEDSLLRYAILQNTSGADIETLKLALKDTDENCRNFALEKHKNNSKNSFFSYIWAMLQDLFSLIILFFIFSKVETDSQRLAVTLLIYICLVLKSDFLDLRYRTMVLFNAGLKNILEAMEDKKLGKKKTEEIKKLNLALEKAEPFYLIHCVFYNIYWVILIYNIILVLFF